VRRGHLVQELHKTGTLPVPRSARAGPPSRTAGMATVTRCTRSTPETRPPSPMA
jgi:hypothetical protein